MNAYNFLFRAIVISLGLHTVFVLTVFVLALNHPDVKKKIHRVEIQYQPRKKSLDVQQRPIKPVQSLDLKNNASASGGIPVKLSKDQSMPTPFAMYERKPEQMRRMEMTRKVSILPMKSEKVNNPAYAAYCEMVRNKTEEKVNQIYARLGDGDVGHIYLTFVVDSSGRLKAAQILEERSDGSRNLHDISLESLKEANPFPPYLKGMTLPEYTFNIEIQYRPS